MARTMTACILLSVVIFIAVAPNSPSKTKQILLKSRKFSLEKGITAAAKNKLDKTFGRAHVIIQLEQSPTKKSKKDLEKRGIKLLAYIPNNAYFASLPASKARQLAKLPGVHAITEILPEDKIALAIRADGINEYSRTGPGRAKLVIFFFKDVDLSDAADIISTNGGLVEGFSQVMNAVVADLPEDAVSTLAQNDSVQWIDQHYKPELLNDEVRYSIGVETVQYPPYDLNGTNVNIGMWEGQCPYTDHNALSDKGIIEDGCTGLASHTTHVAGILIGSEPGENYIYRGMAPAANLFVFGSWVTPAQFEEQYDAAIQNYDIELSTNSWGHGYGRAYGCNCTDPNLWGLYLWQAVAQDEAVRGEFGKKISLIFGAGNEGGLYPSPTYPNCNEWKTLRATAVAKNIISVGAIHTEPGYPLAEFSSRGPTTDGRIKPDLVAPGCDGSLKGGLTMGTWGDDPNEYIWSTNCSTCNDLRVGFGYDYYGLCGTSMSAPVVSGSIALMLQKWRDTYPDQNDPLPSTVKAVLIQTAQDLGYSGPDYCHGWGLINVKDAIDLVDGYFLLLEERENSVEETGDHDDYTIDVNSKHDILKLTLVWDDYPGTLNADPALVNNLNLDVNDPCGLRHYTWTIDINDPNYPDVAAIKDEDNRNNVEQVLVYTPQPGTWSVRVYAAAINQEEEGPQSYSLVAQAVSFPLTFKDPNQNLVAFFDDAGNLYLDGSLYFTVPEIQLSAFRVRTDANDVAAISLSTGDMYIAGTLYENVIDELVPPQGNNFILRNNDENVIAYIDDEGNLYLKGKVYENMDL